MLRQLNRGTTSRLVRSIAINANGSIAAAVSDAGTVHCYALATSGGASGGGGGGGGAAVSTGKSVGNALKGAINLGVGMMPTAVAKSKYVQPLQSYTNAENAVATFRLSDDPDADGEVHQSAPPLSSSGGGGGSGGDLRSSGAGGDLRNSTLDANSSSLDGGGGGGGGGLLYEADGFGLAAQTQPLTLSSDFVCLALRPGLRHESQATMMVAQGALAGASKRVKSRCMRVTIDTTARGCTKEATHLFPKEEL